MDIRKMDIALFVLVVVSGVLRIGSFEAIDP